MCIIYHIWQMTLKKIMMPFVKPCVCITPGITLSAASRWSTDTRWPLSEWLRCSAAAGSSPHSSPSYPSCKVGMPSASRTLWVLSSWDQKSRRGARGDSVMSSKTTAGYSIIIQNCIPILHQHNILYILTKHLTEEFIYLPQTPKERDVLSARANAA